MASKRLPDAILDVIMATLGPARCDITYHPVTLMITSSHRYTTGELDQGSLTTRPQKTI